MQCQGGSDLAPGPLVVGSQKQLALCETPGQMETGLVQSSGLKSCSGRSVGCDTWPESPG